MFGLDITGSEHSMLFRFHVFENDRLVLEVEMRLVFRAVGPIRDQSTINEGMINYKYFENM